MEIPVFHGKVSEDGKLILQNREMFDDYLTYKLAGRDIRLTIEEIRDPRTLSQNSLYWLYLTQIERETGEEADDLHEYLKRKLLPPRFKKILGEEIKLPATTTKLDKIEFINYLDKISALTEIPVPDSEKWKYGEL